MLGGNSFALGAEEPKVDSSSAMVAAKFGNVIEHIEVMAMAAGIAATVKVDLASCMDFLACIVKQLVVVDRHLAGIHKRYFIVAGSIVGYMWLSVVAIDKL